MNTLKKFSMGVVLGVLALTATTTPANAAELFGIGLPELSTVTAEVSKTIAAEMTAQLRNALKTPRPTRVRRPPSVRVIETAEVVVEASRLPPLDGSESERVRTAQVQTQVRL
jgi:hypothetical protein